MFWKKKSKRLRALDTSGPIVDLDAISRDPVPFRFEGKTHFISPISVEEFLRFTNANAAFIERLKSEKPLTSDELVESYAGVIGSVCPTIEAAHIARMEQAQVAALYQLVIDTVTGRVKTAEAEKKTARLGIYEQVNS